MLTQKKKKKYSTLKYHLNSNIYYSFQNWQGLVCKTFKQENWDVWNTGVSAEISITKHCEETSLLTRPLSNFKAREWQDDQFSPFIWKCSHGTKTLPHKGAFPAGHSLLSGCWRPWQYWLQHSHFSGQLHLNHRYNHISLLPGPYRWN